MFRQLLFVLLSTVNINNISGLQCDHVSPNSKDIVQTALPVSLISRYRRSISLTTELVFETHFDSSFFQLPNTTEVMVPRLFIHILQ